MLASTESIFRVLELILNVSVVVTNKSCSGITDEPKESVVSSHANNAPMVVSTNVADDILPKKLFTVDVIIVKVGAIPPHRFLTMVSTYILLLSNRFYPVIFATHIGRVVNYTPSSTQKISRLNSDFPIKRIIEHTLNVRMCQCARAHRHIYSYSPTRAEYVVSYASARGFPSSRVVTTIPRSFA